MEADSKIKDQIATVIDHANNLELRLTLILRKVLRPVNSNYGHVLERALHNTVMPFGAKLLLVKSILDYWHWDDLQKKIGTIDDVLRIRNAFAHTSTAQRVLIVDEMNHSLIANEMIVESKKNSITLERIERSKAFERFEKAYKKSLQVLSDIESKIKSTIVQSAS